MQFGSDLVADNTVTGGLLVLLCISFYCNLFSNVGCRKRDDLLGIKAAVN